jgi:DNA-binding XRE family transcriptional regulator
MPICVNNITRQEKKRYRYVAEYTLGAPIVHGSQRGVRAATVQRASTLPSTFVPPRATLVAMPGLRHWRIARALTQEELAERAGLNRVTVGRLETGTPARLSTVRRLAEALGIDPAELMHPPAND